MTTWAEARGAIPAQIAAVQASALSDEKKRKIVANLRRIQRDLLGTAMTQQEEDAQLRDEWRDFREHQQNASYFDEQLFQQQATTLLQKLSTLPEDDPDPSVLDQVKVKAILRRMTDPAQTAHTTLATRKWAAEKLKQFFDTTVTIPEDPVDLDAEVGMLSAGVIPVEEVTYQMARKIAQQAAKLRPTV